jgi:hypothetical protein
MPLDVRSAFARHCSLETTAVLRVLLVALLVGAGALRVPGAQAQRYRPPIDYRSVDTRHFTFIFPAGADTATVLFRDALARHYEQTQAITGLDKEDFDLPVVVDPVSDVANGFVSPINFRTNLFTAHPTHPLGVKFDSWAQTVAPHELTHAMHFDTDSGVGVGGFVGLFSEDLSRLLYSFQPKGWIEGVAVYRESQIQPEAGRLNSPLATMKYRAALGSDDPWSVGEVMHQGVVERPSNRHYLGGGQLVEHLVDERGSTDFVRRTNQWYHRLPVLGFGVALWIGTGDLPFQISDSFLAAERAEERRRLDSLGAVTEPTVVTGTEGLHVRRPYWLSDSTLVAYVSGYATRPGFYRIDARSGAREVIRHEGISQGRTYALGPDRRTLYYARPHADPLVRFGTTLKSHRLDLRTEEVHPVSAATGTFTPAKAPGGSVWAARRNGSFSTLVTLQADGSRAPVDRPGLQYKQVAPSPSGDTLAVLANAGGEQGLYRHRPGTTTLEPWLRFTNGTIYDVSWGPDGRYLLFAADPSGVANAYALDTNTGDVRRLTTVRYGALEPALSPDGQTLALARYRHERYELVTLPFRPDAGTRLDRGLERTWAPAGPGLVASLEDGSVSEAGDGASLGRQAADLAPQSRPYQAWRHLAPRLVIPTVQDVFEASAPGEELGPGVGVSLSGIDPLERWSYEAGGLYQAGRLWGELSLGTGRVPGTPTVSAFNFPTEATRTVAGAPRLEAFEVRGIGLRTSQTVRLQQNVYTSLVRARLGVQLRQVRAITAESEPESDFSTVPTLVVPDVTAAYRLQQNPRDLMPNTGVRWSARAEADLADPSDLSPVLDDPNRYVLTEMQAHWPLLADYNVGLRTTAAVLSQNRGSLFDAQNFAPRGYRDIAAALPGAGNYLRVGARYVQPLWYVDTGSALLPLALDALYGYGLGEAQYRIDDDTDPTFGQRRASIDTGLGMQVRIPLGRLNVEVGLAYRFDVAGNRWAPLQVRVTAL